MLPAQLFEKDEEVERYNLTNSGMDGLTMQPTPRNYASTGIFFRIQAVNDNALEFFSNYEIVLKELHMVAISKAYARLSSSPYVRHYVNILVEAHLVQTFSLLSGSSAPSNGNNNLSSAKPNNENAELLKEQKSWILFVRLLRVP